MCATTAGGAGSVASWGGVVTSCCTWCYAQLRLELGTDDRTVALRRGYAGAPPVVVHVTEAACGEKRKRN